MEKPKLVDVINKVAAATAEKCVIVSRPERPPKKPFPDIKINRPFEALRGVKIK